MRIGIVSDTHGHVRLAAEAARHFESNPVDTVLHCGDIGSPAIPACFARWPVHFVLGNIDRGHEAELQAAMLQPGHVLHGSFGNLRLGERQVALLHGDDAVRVRSEQDSGTWDLICLGHTHRPEQHRVGRTLVVNPGAVYRSRPHTVAIVDLATWEIRWLEFSLDSATWVPARQAGRGLGPSHLV